MVIQSPRLGARTTRTSGSVRARSFVLVLARREDRAS